MYPTRKRAACKLLAAMLQAGVLLLPGAGLAASVRAPPPDCPPAEVQEIAAGSYVRRGEIALPAPANRGGTANIGFIIGRDHIAVIDTGGSYCDGIALRKAIRKRSNLPISYIINTHAHPDHLFGNHAFADDKPVIIGHHHLPEALQMRAVHYLTSYRRQLGEAAFRGTQIIPPTRLVKASMKLDLGERPLLLTAHPPAHTNHDLTVFDKATGSLWTGDLIFLDHIPVLDGHLGGWLKVTETLMRYPARQVIPGHGPAVARWPEAGERQRLYFLNLIRDLRAAIRKGVPMSAAVSTLSKEEAGRWKLSKAYHSRNITAGYAELEWE